MAQEQNYRIRMAISVEDMELVSSLFRQSDWILSEIGEPLEVEDRPGVYTWTLDVTEDQREAVMYAVTGEVTTVWERPPQQARPEGRLQVLLELTDMQEDWLRNFLQEENWAEEDTIRGYLELEDGQEDVDNVAGGAIQDNIPRYLVIQRRDDYEECQECFAQPCVLHPTNRQEWWPQQPVAPNMDNNIYRRHLYRNFHTMLYRRGIWGDERYLAKKAAMEGANIEREVMPDRVCRWLRYWYPNLPSKPYMGHKNK